MTDKTKEITFNTTVNVLTHLNGMHYLHIPAEKVTALGGGFNRRLICTVNEAVKFQCGLMALGNGDAYISITKARLKKLGLSIGKTVKVHLLEDTSEFGMMVPPELEALLAQDAEGNRRFLLLTPGKRRYIIQYVAAVKNSDKRIERALLLIENLKNLALGKESFREMLGLPRHREV